MSLPASVIPRSPPSAIFSSSASGPGTVLYVALLRNI